MEYGAIDLHLRRSLVRIVNDAGVVLLDQTIATTRAGLEGVFGRRAPLRVVVETGTESEWVAETVEACGHTVVVVDPNYTLMYGSRGRAVKTDRRDVAALADACRLGIYRAAHRASAAQRAVRRTLRVRQQLVRMRTQAINLLRAQLRQEGYRLGTGAAETAVRRCATLELSAALRTTLQPLVDLLTYLAGPLAELDRWAHARVAQEPVTKALMTAPGVGPITALTYRATLDEVTRFASAGAVTAFLGLVPTEHSSGARHRKGRITKAGPRAVRALLVQSAWVLWRQRRSKDALHAWVHRLAARRGRRIAIVALARRLARILYAMWRDQTTYQRVPVAA